MASAVVSFNDGKHHETVEIAGEFSSWTGVPLKPYDNNEYKSVVSNLDPQKSYMYKFIIDGNWILADDGRPVVQDNGIDNHVLVADKHHDDPEVPGEPVKESEVPTERVVESTEPSEPSEPVAKTSETYSKVLGLQEEKTTEVAEVVESEPEQVEEVPEKKLDNAQAVETSEPDAELDHVEPEPTESSESTTKTESAESTAPEPSVAEPNAPEPAKSEPTAPEPTISEPTILIVPPTDDIKSEHQHDVDPSVQNGQQDPLPKAVGAFPEPSVKPTFSSSEDPVQSPVSQSSDEQSPSSASSYYSSPSLEGNHVDENGIIQSSANGNFNWFLVIYHYIVTNFMSIFSRSFRHNS